jgi:hypothetical protein
VHAYLYYLPPARAWVNRFGESYSFDDLARGLMDQPLEKTSCAGTHNVFTLVLLARLDREHPVLPPAARQRLDDWLKGCVRVVRRRQHPDGSWPIDWVLELSSGSGWRGWFLDDRDRKYLLLTTSHLAELLLYLPPDLRAPPDVVRRAGEWLRQELRRATRGEVLEGFCPYSHAACVVRQLMAAPGK